ncbi:hypothetical protein GCM10011514_05340 [Emticicia aquatilis]|uniref:Uncharacterized protein n=1 Tax=Emticicia aquatilis TaxID=1537369 RepID=A0A916YGW3_9BACT|nr:hypothetical protein [Emticicia aquatilis]GGD44328.1 hypothetical protein GCM10011514_05340 [Emticicia aquatilis]
MNPKEYIESGILETYILGLASDNQQEEVEKYLQIFPEVSLALEDLGKVINGHFSASIPPPSVRQRIKEFDHDSLKKWDFNEQTHSQNNTQKEEVKYLEVEVSDTHLRVHKYWRPAFIAIFILSKIFLAAALYFYFKSDSLNKENLKLQQEIELLKK